MEKIYCKDCGAVIEEDKAVKYADGWICRDCYDEKYCICASCGEVFLLDDTTEADGDSYCIDCFDEEFAVCDKCGEVVSKDRRYLFDDRSWCEDCYYDAVGTCGRCGYEYYRDDLSYSESADSYYCNDCYNEGGFDQYHDESCYIRNYEYKPEARFYGEGRFYLGMEQEINFPFDGKHSAAGHIHELDTQECEVYLKHDGTITNGFEVVTHPRTFASWKEFVHCGTFKKVLDVERYHRARGHGYGGIHIHTSLDAWKPDQLFKLFRFFFNPANRSGIEALSQRSRYKLKAYATLDFKVSEENEPDIKNKSCYTAHHNALNMTDTTLEFRIFNSSIRPDRVMKDIEAVTAMYQYTKSDDVSWEGFVRFVAVNNGEFPNLYSFLQEKALLPEAALAVV